MKTIKIIVSVILLLIMFGLTALGFFLKVSLVGGSINSMEDIVAINGAWLAIIVVIFGFLLFYSLYKPSNVKLIFLGVIIVIWFLSGRMISIIFWPDGRVTTGWFGIPTDTFYLCTGKTDCETTIAYHTKTENLFFWRIRLKNENVDKVIFVGPFIWNKTLKLVHDQIGAGTYTK